MSAKSGKNRRSTSRPAIEWVVGALSGGVLVALAAFLLHQALLSDARPPQLSVAIDAIDHAEGDTIVKITVANGGDVAAAGVSVLAARTDAPPDGSNRQIEFDYIAGQAVRHGAFVFADAQIGASDVRVEIGGFIEP